jgi:hypothetical protein
VSLRFGSGGDAARSAAIRALKATVTTLLDIGPDDTVMVSELRCLEPGCPPLETVIAVLRSGESPQQYKIHKSALEVGEDDVRAVLAGGAAHVH